MVRLGMSERELAWLIERALREEGAEAIAFDVIAASGPNAALPHHHPGDRLLQEGDSLIIDMGAQAGGYKSDLTRTFYLGAEPERAVPGLSTTLPCAPSRRPSPACAPASAAWPATPWPATSSAPPVTRTTFGHGLGHGVGLFIHELPRLSPLSTTAALEAGMVVTVEPGIYLPGWGGVRIEDLVLITDRGRRTHQPGAQRAGHHRGLTCPAPLRCRAHAG
jgi:Xaa-Pro aminopeptidase